MEVLAKSGAIAFSTDAIPRTTRAQAMDTLSSMGSVSGYKGVLLAAVELPRYLPMLSSAAGTVFPAKVFVIGAAVVGLQALATAKRLGAMVSATDVRPEVKEQIESVGAKYVGIELTEDASAGGGYAKELSPEDQQRQRDMLIDEVSKSDVVNPAANTDESSPIYGVPIIEASKARTVFAIKRSKNPGFAGIDNALYFDDKTWMLFGDAKYVVGELIKDLSGKAG